MTTTGPATAGRPSRVVPDAEVISAIALAAGVDAVGVATAAPFDSVRHQLESQRADGLAADMAFTYRNPSRSTDPGHALAGARALVVGARGYRRLDPVRPARASGGVARYARVDHYAELRVGLAAVATELVRHGWRAMVLCDDNALVDRAAAHRAGLGWYGKSANLLLPGAGSWFVLGSVVTDAPLVGHDPPPVADACGACTRCIDACPTGAIVASGVVDARRCLAWTVQAPGAIPVEQRVALGGRLYGCDDCQEVCPPNRSADRRVPPVTADPVDAAWVDLVDLLAADDAELLQRHGRWYVPHRDPAYLRRNALVALGNVGDPHDPTVRSAVARYVDAGPVSGDGGGLDELLAEHARWASGRLDERAGRPR